MNSKGPHLNRQVRILSQVFTALFAVSLIAAGCGDARLSTSGTVDNPRNPYRPGGDRPDGGTPGTPNDDDDIIPPTDNPTCALIPLSIDTFVGVDSSVQIGVYQYDISTGTVMVDERVSFRIVEDESVEGLLSSENVRTNTSGLAAVRLTAGPEAGTIKVRAVSACAAPMEIEVDVLELPTGDLRVGFNYPFRDVYDVHPIEVQIYPAEEINCRSIPRGARPSGSIYTAEARDVTSVANFGSLRTDVEYTVLALGRGRWGERAAHGCFDAVFVREGRVTEITIDLFLLPLDPVGDYDVLSHWDFRDAIAESGEVGRLIVQILDIFDNPGRGIVNLVMDLVIAYVGGAIGWLVDQFLSLTGIKRMIENAINSLIASSPFLSQIVQIGRDIRQVIAELEVISILNIGKLGSDYEVYGRDRWIGMALYWRLSCIDDPDPACGRHEIILDSMELGLLEGNWTGRVVGYDRLDIDRHPVDFEYGRLIIYVIEYMILPAITGRPAPVRFEDALSGICTGMDLECFRALGFEICLDVIADLCNTAVSLFFGPFIRTFMENLRFDTVLDIRGSCTLLNRDEDLGVDALVNGDYIGNIYIGSSPTPFTTDFCGVAQEGPLDLVATCLAR